MQHTQHKLYKNIEAYFFLNIVSYQGYIMPVMNNLILCMGYG
jgi:hypothetical protein